MEIPPANHQHHLVVRHWSVDFKTHAFGVKQSKKKKNVGKNSKGENSKKERKKVIR